MSFADHMLTENLEPLRQRLLDHPLWKGIEQGTLPRETLRIFALQDWWLVREAYRLDALAVVGMPDLEMQELLLTKLLPKIGAYKLLLSFGEALGLTQAEFDKVEPLAGCMALTNYFYWMLAYGSLDEFLTRYRQLQEDERSKKGQPVPEILRGQAWVEDDFNG